MAFEHLARLGENRLNLTWEDVRHFGERVYRFRAFDLKDSQESEIVANCVVEAKMQQDKKRLCTMQLHGTRQQQPQCQIFF